MVQSVGLSMCSAYLKRTVKKCGKPSSAKNLALPIILATVGLFLAKKDKNEKNKNTISEKVSVDLNTLEYSAWARLNDLGTHKDESFNPINAKDSNKWNQVFRS